MEPPHRIYDVAVLPDAPDRFKTISSPRPGQSWYDLDALREGAEVFTALSHDHIALEESYIYPQARARLRPGERREMGREMAARRRAERNARAG